MKLRIKCNDGITRDFEKGKGTEAICGHCHLYIVAKDPTELKDNCSKHDCDEVKGDIQLLHEKIAKLEENNVYLSDLHLTYISQIADLKNENSQLRRKLEFRKVGVQEERLLQTAKDVIRILSSESMSDK
ncbi:hypothetical protein [Paenibacillus sp. Leaf72]|uniref:hypothetical protein n=1 Tax=Paenibacillus sp. Leaf72 TaxID=1736234 RepID=UPI000702293B|nr:hypothetical protein [Paenibacillus sp. Leaf72]KQN96997.1 hypothetical protein ASF12_23295 [Paenibacillus sp. Leaf72]